MRSTGLPVVLATSRGADNDLLASWRAAGLPVFRGDEDDVLRGTWECARQHAAGAVVRVTGDNPLTDLETVQDLVAAHVTADADYTYVPATPS